MGVEGGKQRKKKFRCDPGGKGPMESRRNSQEGKKSNVQEVEGNEEFPDQGWERDEGTVAEKD